MASDATSLFERVYALDRRGGANVIELSAVDDEPESPLWIILDFSREESRKWISEQSGVDPIVADALLADDARPRAVNFDDGLLIVLRGVNTNPGADPNDMVSIRLWVEKNRVIATRRRRLLSVQDVIDQLDRGKGPKLAGDVLSELIERMADRIGDYVEKIEDVIEQLEVSVGDASMATTRVGLAQVRRHVAGVRRFLAPQRDALDRLYRQGAGFLEENAVNLIREQADRITRNLEDLDLAREQAIVLQEELLSQMASEQNSRLFVLSIVAAIFLPLSFVTGLFGMNVAGLPGTEDPRSFLVLALAMVVVCIGLLVFFRWKKWV